MVQGTLHRSIRSEIERNMKEQGYTISKTSEMAGMNPGSLSDFLNYKRSITIFQLDSLAEVFGQLTGWLYELYTEECVSEGKVSRPRLIPYLVRCAETGRQDCIDTVVTQLLDNPKHISILFSVAEELFEEGKGGESIAFYEYVVDNEKDSFSHQFVMSQYRLFRLRLGVNSEENRAAAIRFDPYRRRLPENYQLDALLQLANVSFTLQEWEKLKEYAEELLELSTIIYENELLKYKRTKSLDLPKTERHLVVYYGKGHLIKGYALMMQEQYKDAKKCVEKYIDLTWFELLDDKGRKEVEKLNVWGQAYLYTISLMEGDFGVLDDYIKFLEANPHEIHPALPNIMEYANKHNFAVDDLLERFSEQIAELESYNNAINISRRYRFWEQKYEYEFKKGNILRAIDELIHCMELTIVMNNYHGFKRCVSLFWSYFSQATTQQKEKFQYVLLEKE